MVPPEAAAWSQGGWRALAFPGTSQHGVGVCSAFHAEGRRWISAGPHPKAHLSQFMRSCGLEQTGTLSLSSWLNKTEHLVLFCSSADGALK